MTDELEKEIEAAAEAWAHDTQCPKVGFVAGAHWAIKRERRRILRWVDATQAPYTQLDKDMLRKVINDD